MRNLFIISILFISFITLSSCEKEDAYAVKCFGDSCQQTIDYPACQDNYYLIISDDPEMSPIYCPNGCLNGQCIPDTPECTSGMTQCLSDVLLQTCVDNVWVISECEERCENGACIDRPTCFDFELRCSDSNIEICTDGQWVLYEICPVDCHDAECTSCDEGEMRCSDVNIEVCIDGTWTILETCLYGCQNGSCLEGCSGPDYCSDSTTLQQCINGNWQTTSCPNGCESGKCRPEQDLTDPRLTGRLCTRDDFKDDKYLMECSGYKGNPLGTVCIAHTIELLYCLERCDPNDQPNYYCYYNYWSGAPSFAFTAECHQISDGTYALINTGASACAKDCTAENGCDEVVEYYPNPGLKSCNPNSYYCDGTKAHTCDGTIECSKYGNKVCVQFGVPTYCATPCETEGETLSVCVYQYSNSATCMRDDRGTLTWQYDPILKCPNGCNQKTGLCN